jgi:putative restriction endonuclease
MDQVQAHRLIYERTHGEPRLVVPRVGQGSFKAVTAEAYHHCCAITGDKVRPVLQAAHIRPISKGGEHRLDNGLLLRSDVHTLFDCGYIGIDTKYHLRVSPALRADFGNGDYFYAHEGDKIATPSRPVDRPNTEFLEWHGDEVFQTRP